MNLKPLALLHSFLQRVSRSSWLLFLTFMVVQTGFAQQNLISEAQLVDPSKLIAPSNTDNLVPTSANVAATLSATNGTSDYYYVCSWANIPAQCSLRRRRLASNKLTEASSSRRTVLSGPE